MSKALKNLYADNFMVYFKAHTYHFNVLGNTFSQDHALLQELYELLWGMHDTIGEQLRICGEMPPYKLSSVIDSSLIDEPTPTTDPQKMFNDLLKDLHELEQCTQSLYTKTTEYGGLQTFLGDYLKAITKITWKIKSQRSPA